MMKLSLTQRAILELAVESENPDYFTDCVYDRNRRGLERIGAIAQDRNGRWFITDEAHEEMTR
jgi:hypothetical protein